MDPGPAGVMGDIGGFWHVRCSLQGRKGLLVAGACEQQEVTLECFGPGSRNWGLWLHGAPWAAQSPSFPPINRVWECDTNTVSQGCDDHKMKSLRAFVSKKVPKEVDNDFTETHDHGGIKGHVNKVKVIKQGGY